MSDDSPTRRLSQIFGSLSCLSDLQNHDIHASRNGGGSHKKNASQQQQNKYVPTKSSIPLPSTSNQTLSSSSSSQSSSNVQSSNNHHHRLHIGSSNNAQSSRIMMGSRSTPNSPRMMPKNNQRTPPAIPQRPNAALIANPGIVGIDADSQWTHFSSLTDHLDVHQLNNYSQGLPEINWQERCLELQLELHRSKSQSGRIRDMLRDKVSQ